MPPPESGQDKEIGAYRMGRPSQQHPLNPARSTGSNSSSSNSILVLVRPVWCSAGRSVCKQHDQKLSAEDDMMRKLAGTEGSRRHKKQEQRSKSEHLLPNANCI